MRVLLTALLASVTAVSHAAAQEFETPADYAAILDSETGTVLFCKNCNEPMAPASMSKIMTIELVFERLASGDLAPDEQFTITENAWRKGGAASGSSTMFLAPNSQASVIDLVHGVIIQSGNDASIALAEGLEGSEEAFADVMTKRAHELGLDSATFRNATGWPDPEHEISALDLARLANHQITTYPDLYKIYADREFTYNDVRQFNRNPLLSSFDGADGLKTGHTQASGYGLVGSAVRDGERRVIVFNGLDSESARAQEAERMMRAAFVDFKIFDLYEAGEEVGQGEVFMGQADSVTLKTAEPVAMGMHRRARDQMKAYITYDGAIRAPVAEGDEVARLVIEAPDAAPRSYPLVAVHAVEQKGLFGRAMTGLVSLIRGDE